MDCNLTYALPNSIPRRAGFESVCCGINNKRHRVRKRTLSLRKIPTLVSIGPLLNKTQLFKILKIYKRYMDCRTHRPDVYTFLSKFWSFLMYVSCSIQAQSTPTLRMFLTPTCPFSLRGSRVVYPIINRLVPSPPRLNNGVSLKVLFLFYPWFTRHDLAFILQKKNWFAYKSFCLIPDAILEYLMFSPGRTQLIFLGAASSSK